MVWNRNLRWLIGSGCSHTVWVMLIVNRVDQFLKQRFFESLWFVEKATLVKITLTPYRTGHALKIDKTIFLLKYWSDGAEISHLFSPPRLVHIVFQLPPDFWSIQPFLFLALPSTIEFLLPNLFDIFQLRFELHFLLATLQSPTAIVFWTVFKLMGHKLWSTLVQFWKTPSQRFLGKDQSALIWKPALLLQLLLPH